MSTVISIEKVSKLYRLGEVGTGSLAHDLNRWWHKVRGNPDPYQKVGETNDRTQKGNSDYVYAIKDISFEVKQGQALGIIGRNGAGKSTLLKILARVTTPTNGEIKVKGRIASLLEVGTGFHPELTGRDNIFLNGAILGMRKTEIQAKFDEIVEFSGCDRYIDTPVKRYSSGMYVRLAFAVAAHLEPEILIVDEVLAVGDAEFQKKCIGKMKDVASVGRTVIFVSHDLHAVQRLCTEAVYLAQGGIIQQGSTEMVIDAYLKSASTSTQYDQRIGTGAIRLISAATYDEFGNETDRITSSSTVAVKFICEAVDDCENVMFSVCFNTLENLRVATFYSSYKGHAFDIKRGRFEAVCKIPNLSLMPGDYKIISAIDSKGIMLDAVYDIKTVHVGLGKSSRFLTPPDMRQGFYIENFEWSVEHNCV